MNTNVCKCYKDPEAADRPYIRYIKIYFYKVRYSFNCLCPCFFMCGGHRIDSSTSRNGRVIKWAGHRRARDIKCCLQLISGRMSETPSTAAVYIECNVTVRLYMCY
jgi:hypothetical protein